MNIKTLLTTAFVTGVCMAAQAFPTIDIVPAPGEVPVDDAQKLTSFNIVLDGLSVVGEPTATFENLEQGDVINSTQFYYWNAVGAVMIKFAADDFQVNGEWELNIPAGSLSYNGETNPTAIKYVYNLKDKNLDTSAYPQIDLVNIDPADGTSLSTFGKTLGEVKIKTSNDAAVNYIGWELVDITTNEFIRSGSENRIDVNRNGHADDVWVDGLFFKIGGYDAKLVKGHDYRLSLKFCGIGYDPITNQYPNSVDIAKSLELETSVVYHGLTEPQEYSPYKFVSISPDPETYEFDNIDLRSFTMTWDGPVKPTEFIYSAELGTANAGEFAAVNPDENGYANAWEFTFDESVLKNARGGLYTSVAVKDADGLYVKGNADMEFDNIYYGMEWSCNIGAYAITSVSPTDGETVTSLSSITVGNENNLEMNLSYMADDSVKIYKDGRDLVATLGEPEQSENLTEMTWTFDELTAPGVYTIIIPKSYFNVGTEFDSTTSNQTVFRYIIEGEVSGEVTDDFVPVNVEPADNENLEKLDKLTLTFSEIAYDNTFASNYEMATAQIYKENADGTYTLIDKVIGDPTNWDAPKVFVFTPAKPITEDGKYRVTFAEKSFINTEYDQSMGESGRYSPELNYYYTIGNANGVDGIAAEDGTVTVYDLVGRLLLDKAPAAEINTLSAGLYIINGKKTVIK